MSPRWTLPAFSGYGIEIEHMIVDRDTLDVRPIADRLLQSFAGNGEASEVERGPLGWSNELAAHVIELKNIAPTTALQELTDHFQTEVQAANRVLAPLSARLMPTGMHPWMDPARETVLWSKDSREIYETYNRIFSCRGHGWSNIQSVQINLPFADEPQFARLHAAIRLVVPLLPALAAASPIADGRDSSVLDFRIEAYSASCSRAPAAAGQVVPETIVSRDEYQSCILDPMYRQIEQHDPAGVLRHEWLNARGAIARFDRNAIELRLVDTQENPRLDVAIAGAAIAAARALYDETWSALEQQQAVSTQALVHVLQECTRAAEEAVIEDTKLLEVLGMKARVCSAAAIWEHLLASGADEWWRPQIAFLLNHGTLARRILRAIGGQVSHERLREVYARLCDCLDAGLNFE